MKRVAILGSGNIGCDLLVKCIQSEHIKINCFAGRHPQSSGLSFATRHGVPITDRSIQGILELKTKTDILIDCTSADHHLYHYELCKQYGIRILDMTPAKLGISCCPAVNLSECLDVDNINMISCGGQASIPLCHAIKQSNPHVSYIEIVSTISSSSAGPGTRQNISQYIKSTQAAVNRLAGVDHVKVMINITPAIPPIHMKTTILVRSDELTKQADTSEAIQQALENMRTYVPGVDLSVQWKQIGDKTMCQVVVHGSGHYLPPYAGNLDIINCAALEVIRNL